MRLFITGSGATMSEKPQETKAMPVPEYGRTRYGMGRAGSYRAAARGDWPTVKIGNRVYVCVEAADRQLDQAK
jgi:hypothetical protein